MSARMMGMVWELDLPHSKQSILLAFADHADHEGNNVYPSIGLIAWKTGYSSRQVIRIVKTLVQDDKLLVPVKAAFGEAIHYRLNLAAGRKKEPRVKRRRTLVAKPAGGDKMSEVEAPPVDRGGDNLSEVKPASEEGGGDIAMSDRPMTQLRQTGCDTAVSHKPSSEPSIQPSIIPSALRAEGDAKQDEVFSETEEQTTEPSKVVVSPKQVSALVKSFASKVGYALPSPGAESKAGRWMLEHSYTPRQIFGCYDYLKSDSFWGDKQVSLMVVKTKIGEWVKNGQRKQAVPPGKVPGNGQLKPAMPGQPLAARQIVGYFPTKR